MAEKNIEMNVMNKSGGYDVLYPKTTPEQAGSLSIGGGTLNGNLYLNADPTSNMGAATKQYVDNYVGSLVNTGDYLSDKWNLVFDGTLNGNGWRDSDFQTFTINNYVSEIFCLFRNVTLYGELQGEIKLTDSTDTEGGSGAYILGGGGAAGINITFCSFRGFLCLDKHTYQLENERVTSISNNSSSATFGVWSSIKADIEIYMR